MTAAVPESGGEKEKEGTTMGGGDGTAGGDGGGISCDGGAGAVSGDGGAGGETEGACGSGYCGKSQ